MARQHIIVRGRVQGVGFRLAARAEAERLGVAGWVRNLPDGTVEAVAEGEPQAVEAFAAWCRRGPKNAAVREVLLNDEPPQGERGFAIR